MNNLKEIKTILMNRYETVTRIISRSLSKMFASPKSNLNFREVLTQGPQYSNETQSNFDLQFIKSKHLNDQSRLLQTTCLVDRMASGWSYCVCSTL